MLHQQTIHGLLYAFFWRGQKVGSIERPINSVFNLHNNAIYYRTYRRYNVLAQTALNTKRLQQTRTELTALFMQSA